MFLELDLAGAEWVIVAYLADDPAMISVVESGESPHVATGHFMTDVPKEHILLEHKIVGSATDPEMIKELRLSDPKLEEMMDLATFLPRSMSIRQAGKKSNHGLNYDMRYKRFALTNEIPENESSVLVDTYHSVYPGVRQRFHKDIQNELRKTRSITDLFGNKVRLLDQPGPDLYDKAYSYKPQSTVANIVKRAMRLCYNDRSPLFRLMEMCANVHDSLLFDYPSKPWDRFVEFAHAVRDYMSPELSVNGHTFTLNVDAKYGKNWGDMKPLKLEDRLEKLPTHGLLPPFLIHDWARTVGVDIS